MESWWIAESYNLLRTYRGAAELVGCDPKTASTMLERRDAGLEPDAGLVRSSIADGFRPKPESTEVGR